MILKDRAPIPILVLDAVISSHTMSFVHGVLCSRLCNLNFFCIGL